MTTGQKAVQKWTVLWGRVARSIYSGCTRSLWGVTGQHIFPVGVNEVGNLLGRRPFTSRLQRLTFDCKHKTCISARFGTAFAVFEVGEVGGASSLFGASFSVGTTSDDLDVRIVCNLVVGGPCSSVTLGSCRRPADAVWANAECLGDRCQRWDDARCRNTLYASSCKPDVAGCDIEHAAAISSGPSAAGPV